MVDELLRSEPLGLPLPPSWLLALKLSGFLLHMIFMNLWLAGLPAALCLRRRNPFVADRLFRAMPFFMAFGINAGIVPLLFLQTLYPQFFYPATILQAWFWFVVIPLLIIAYYAVYLAAFDRYRSAAAVVASVILTWIGLTFASALNLTAAPAEWPAIFSANAEAGAVRGLFLYLRSESVFRFLLMVGISLGTLATFFALDAEYFSADSNYRNEARRLVAPLYCLGLAVFGGVGIFYGPMTQDQLPLLPWLLAGLSVPVGAALALVYGKHPGRRRAGFVVGAHCLVVFFNGLARQSVQARKLDAWAKLDTMPVRGEWGSFFFFVIVLTIVLIALLWLARIARRAF